MKNNPLKLSFLFLLSSNAFADFVIKVHLDDSYININSNSLVDAHSYEDFLNALFLKSPSSESLYDSTCSLFPNGIKNDYTPESTGIKDIDANCIHLSGSDFSGLSFINSAIAWSNFSGSNLSSITMQDLDMRYTDFYNANLSNSTIELGAYNYSNFNNANMSNSNFYEPSFDNSSFNGTNLSNSTFHLNTSIDGALFENTNLNGANFVNSNSMVNTQFKNSDLRNVNFGAGTGFQNTLFDGVDLRGAVFSDSLDITAVSFNNILYDETTVWPSWFTPPPSR